MCGFALDDPLWEVCHILGMETSGTEWESREKGVLHLRRNGQSDLLALLPSDHTGNLRWPEILSYLSSTRVRLLKGQKKKGEGGKSPSEGHEGKLLTLSRQGVSVCFPLGL